MTIVGAFEAKTHFSQLLRRVEEGEGFEIQRRGKTVAKLTAVTERIGADELHATLSFFRKLRTHARVTARELVEWRDEGRA